LDAINSNSEERPLDDFDRDLERYLRDERERARTNAYDGIPQLDLLWMALAPEWTRELVRACNFPSVDGVGTLEQMNRLGLVNVEQSPVPENHERLPVYSITASVRAQTLQPFLQDSAGLNRLRELVPLIANEVLRYPQLATPATLRWAALASEASFPESFVAKFDSLVENAFASHDSAEILVWIEIARALVFLFGSDTTAALALQKAGRRVELLHRREIDQQHLQKFKKRDEQLQAFVRLMGEDDQHWALHYLGAGGVGKTMLLRHLGANVCAQEYEAAVARVDFDFLNPDYPDLSPGLLLWAFAQELMLYAPDESARRYFADGDSYLRIQNQRRRGERGDLPRATDELEFRQALGFYIDGFKAIGKRLVLFVDTCEELAKIRPQNVDETFKILRALHDGPQILDNDAAAPDSTGLPSLRVIFAGRRLLGSKGYGWSLATIDGMDNVAGTGQEELKPRDFLRLNEIRGFTGTEADDFLRDIMKVRRALWGAIKTKSEWQGQNTYGIQYQDKSDRPAETARYHPYDLRNFASWANDDPALTPEAMENASGSQFIESRIINRLRDPRLEKILPATAMLQHLDIETMNALSGTDPETAEALFLKLRKQDWTTEHRIAAGVSSKPRVVLDIDPVMCGRLLDYFAERGVDLDEIRSKAAELLIARTLNANEELSAMDWSTFDSATRVIESAPERAVRWWLAIEQRLLNERNFQWVCDLIRPLRGEAGVLSSSESKRSMNTALRCLIMATYASALLHIGDTTEAEAEWHEVQRTLQDVGSPLTAELYARALAARVSLILFKISLRKGLDDDTPDARARRFWEQLENCATFSLQVFATHVAAVEAIVESAEQTGKPHLEIKLLERWAHNAPPELKSYAIMLAGRAALIEHESSEAMELAREALQVAPEPHAVPVTWADWIAPTIFMRGLFWSTRA
jgi:hypothetical protein